MLLVITFSKIKLFLERVYNENFITNIKTKNKSKFTYLSTKWSNRLFFFFQYNLQFFKDLTRANGNIGFLQTATYCSLKLKLAHCWAVPLSVRKAIEQLQRNQGHKFYSNALLRLLYEWMILHRFIILRLRLWSVSCV